MPEIGCDCQIACFVFLVLLHNLSALDNFPFPIPQNFSAPLITQIMEQDLQVATTLLTSAYVQILKGFQSDVSYYSSLELFVLHYTSQALDVLC